MDVLLISNVLVIKPIDGYPLFIVRRAKQVDKVSLKVVAEAVDVLLGILAYDLEVAHMRFGGNVAFESERYRQ